MRKELEISERYEILLIVALGTPGEKVVLEDAEPGGDVTYYREMLWCQTYTFHNKIGFVRSVGLTPCDSQDAGAGASGSISAPRRASYARRALASS